jgi:hypothetical protein
MLREFPLYTPIIAAGNGVCVGLGADLLLATDIRNRRWPRTFRPGTDHPDHATQARMIRR